MPRTKLLELLFVTTAGLGMLFVGWAVLIGSTPTPMPTTVAPVASTPTPTFIPIPTIPPTPTPTPPPITLTVLHTNDTWGYVQPCG
jgi:2',3'-cyclic-nucleotide 2'-phosphodiesterase (5'-nucleotidase family)